LPDRESGDITPMPVTVILDVDGTLVDTNYHHALAWHRALRARGRRAQMWQIHRHIGIGGDRIVAALVGDEIERSEGDAIRAAEGEAYGRLIGEVEPLQGARELLEDLRSGDVVMVLASSAKQEEVDHYLDLLDARDLVDGWTSSADVEQTKPAADLVHAALDKAGAEGPALMIGDSVWDVKAAGAAGVPTLAVLTGGFSEAELREAGAVEVVESIAALSGDGEAVSERVARLAGRPG
jgi:HAD superfamily hydrolase (TIGR01509 family)